MKNLFLLGALIIISFPVLAQKAGDTELVRSRLQDLNTLSEKKSPLMGFDNREGSIIGSKYLYDLWIPAILVLANSRELEGVQIKLDLLNNLVEVKADGKVRVGDQFTIKEFFIPDLTGDGQERRFISLASRKTTKPGLGFGEVIFCGNVTLVRHYFLVVKDPDYVASLDMGSRDTKLFKKDEILLIQDGNIDEVSQQSFGDLKDEMKAFMKKNKLKLKEEKDLVEIVAYYDSLIKDAKAPAAE